MKKFIGIILSCFLHHICSATLFVNILQQPDTIVCTGNAVEYHIDFENNGVDDVYFWVSCNPNINFNSENSQNWTAQCINGQEGIAYTCGSSMTATNTWCSNTFLAYGGSTNYQFDGKGQRYLAIRKYLSQVGPYVYYSYGWIKIECSEDGSQLIVYGWAYSDEGEIETQPTNTPSIRAGLGECYTSVNELYLPKNTFIKSDDKLVVTFSEPLTINIYDISGRNVRVFKFEGGTNSYDITSFTSNIYFAEVKSRDKVKVLKLFL